MLSNFESLLVKRFLFSKKTDGYISVFSWFSIIGIMIGVAAIIIVMSVMNGFREELTKRLIGINGHLNIFSNIGKIHNTDITFIKNIKEANVKILPLIETQALIIANNKSRGVLLRGFDKNEIANNNFFNNNLADGNLFSNIKNEVIIGYVLANKLQLKIGDKIKIAIPKTDKTIFGNIPRFKTMKVSGIFNFGMYEYDANFIFTNLTIPRKLLMLEENTFNKIEVFTDIPQEIEDIQKLIQNRIKVHSDKLYTISWKQNNSNLINALKVEKNVMFLILTLIIVVASMNIISGLIIFVKEKDKDIGILKTIGLNNKSLIKIFLSIGLLIGFIGTSLGAITGIIFSLNIRHIQNFLENIFNINLFSKEIYYLSSLPSRLDFFEVLLVITVSLIICLFATILPAFRSSQIDPISSLKND
ncbi:MAG: Lipoprotein-releasing system transmembrane protein LolE [Alphaproteobacteria bacterium MarineAlpha5_Bin8]|nr:MAG: Lipoprotein-releasing system transmembrane protein LolE [Alphaproteobacteria bacterium MarineAlpha5_Bin8]